MVDRSIRSDIASNAVTALEKPTLVGRWAKILETILKATVMQTVTQSPAECANGRQHVSLLPGM